MLVSIFTGNISQSVKLIGKKATYSKNIRDWIFKLTALLLIPIKDIAKAYEIITTETPNGCEAILEYFEFQWLTKIKPELWNHFIHSDHRTNNRAEGFHSKINKLITKKNANIFHLINLLKSIELESILQLRRSNLDTSQISTTRNKKDIKKDLVIEMIKCEYSSILFDEFFSKICSQAYIFSFFLFKLKLLFLGDGSLYIFSF